ncbi:hypothetical protein [Shewanella sp. WPAGA9]|uniref:hypothetical protein n=1 Tax=Shewanella sp. ENK2 TaxID=2775245 RepID=UPI00177ED17B|nr:hypothetical protein [Shewanella sp. WPAGA9]
MQLFESPHFGQVTIIGNANGDWQASKKGYSIIFNGTVAEGEHIINICNGPFAGSTEDFVVTGHHNKWLSTQLSAIAHELQSRLNCWPSSGLACFILFSRLTIPLSLTRMSLLPNLARNNTMTKNEHLPCVVHNWLGERRIALSQIKESPRSQINWPALLLSSDNNKTLYRAVDVTSEQSINDSPFTLLAKIANLQSSTPEGVIALEKLANLPLSHWLACSTQSNLLDVEPLFFNQQPEKNAGIWYLSDNHASQYLDSIRLSLAICQQALLK